MWFLKAGVWTVDTWTSHNHTDTNNRLLSYLICCFNIHMYLYYSVHLIFFVCHALFDISFPPGFWVLIISISGHKQQMLLRPSVIPHAENRVFVFMRKQRRSYCTADQRLRFRYSDSTIPPLFESDISSF